MENKCRNWIFLPTKEWSLGLKELVVYSFMAYRSRYPENTLTHLDLCHWCGLTNKAVRNAIDNLEAEGLLLTGEVQRAPHDMFSRKAKPSGEHWSQQFATWLCYVRQVNATLTFTDVCVWSYLRHCYDTNWVPTQGWSYSLVARTLCIGRDTLKQSLSRLDGALLQYDGSGGDMKVNLYKNVPQEMWSAFRDKKSKGGSIGTGLLGEIDGPEEIERVGNYAWIVTDNDIDHETLRQKGITSQAEYDAWSHDNQQIEMVLRMMSDAGIMTGSVEVRRLAMRYYVANGKSLDGMRDTIKAERAKGIRDLEDRTESALRSNREALQSST